MKWKSFLAVILIIAILALLYFSPQGRNYSSFLSNIVGNVVSIFSSKETFAFSLSTSKIAFEGKALNMPNSSFEIKGTSNYVKIQDVTGFSPGSVDLKVSNFKGVAEITETSIRVNGEASRIELNSVVFITDRSVMVEAEVTSDSYSLNSIFQESLDFDSLTGQFRRVSEDKTVTVDVSNEKVTIKNFAGNLQINEGEASLVGVATSVTGKTFKFP